MKILYIIYEKCLKYILYHVIVNDVKIKNHTFATHILLFIEIQMDTTIFYIYSTKSYGFNLFSINERRNLHSKECVVESVLLTFVLF